jgi:AsmA family protein
MTRRRALALTFVLLAGLPLLLAAVVLALGLTIDGTRWSGLLARQASSALGRPVELAAPVRLTLGRTVQLQIGSLRVPGRDGPAAPVWLLADDLRLAVDLADLPGLLRGTARLRRVEAAEITLVLEPAAGTPAPAPAAVQVGQVQVGQVQVGRLAVHPAGARTAGPAPWVFESVAGSSDAAGAVRIRGVAQVDGWPVARFSIDAGPPATRADGGGRRPLAVRLKADGARLDASGSVDASARALSLELAAEVEEPARLGRRLGLELPPLGGVALRGQLDADGSGATLTALQARLPGAAVEGRLAWAQGAGRPRLSGALSIAELDLGPTIDALSGRPADTRADGWASLGLPGRLPFDVDLQLAVARAVGLPLDVSDATLHWQADAAGQRVPIEARLAGARASARVLVDNTLPTPALSLALELRELPVGRAWHAVTGGHGVEGRVDRASLRAHGRGQDLGDWARGLEAELSLSGADAVLDVGRQTGPLRLRLDHLQLHAPRAGPLRATASGLLGGKRVLVTASSPSAGAVLDHGAWPVDARLATAAATLRLRADALAWAAAGDAALAFELQAARAGDLAPWLGVAPASALPVATSGRLRRAGDAWHVDAARLQLGRSDATVDARMARASAHGVGAVRLRSARLDLSELATLRPGAGAAGPGAAGSVGWPTAGTDLDLSAELQQLWLGGVELRDLGLAATVRQGVLLASPLHASIAGARFEGSVAFDPLARPMNGRVELASGPLDVGRLLRDAGLAGPWLDGRADTLRVAVRSQGRDLSELAAGADLQASWVGGALTLHAPGRRRTVQLRLHEAELALPAGQPLQARLNGVLDDTPLQMELRLATLAELQHRRSALPFALTARAAGAEIALDGQVALPLGRDASLQLRLGGARLDSLNVLAGVELPPWGPWSVQGPLLLTPSGYELPGLQLRVGQSRLDGSVRLDLDGPRPHLALQVLAPSIQLDDFPPPAQLADPPPRRPAFSALRDKAGAVASQVSGQTDRLLGARFLRRFDADVDIQVKELRSGPDRVADFATRLALRDGRLDMDPLVARVPGGQLRLSAAYDVTAPELSLSLAAAIDRFDYGIIARRLGRGTDVRGHFSLQLALHGRAPSLDTVLHHASGHVDIAVWPEGLRSGVFDLWSVNLVLALVPLIDPGGNSAVNCVVGRFDLHDGVLRDEQMFIDTTSVRIRGRGTANLRTEALDLVFRPRAKGVAIFRLQNPLRVTGTLFDQHLGFNRRDLPGSVLRLVASPVLWPIEQLTLGPLPRDGADLCTDPLRPP